MKEKISKIDKNFYTDILLKHHFKMNSRQGELYHQLPRIKYQQSVTKIKHSIL